MEYILKHWEFGYSHNILGHSLLPAVNLRHKHCRENQMKRNPERRQEVRVSLLCLLSLSCKARAVDRVLACSHR